MQRVHEHANFTPSITAREQARVNGYEHFEGRSTVDTNDGTRHHFCIDYGRSTESHAKSGGIVFAW